MRKYIVHIGLLFNGISYMGFQFHMATETTKDFTAAVFLEIVPES